MPKDTLDDKTVLEILRMADKDMLRKSGNPVYLSLKAEYDRLRSEQSGQHSENDAIEHDPSCYFNRPILGVRIGAGGQRLVYRVNRPRTAGSQHTQVDADKSIEETDKTLVDIIPDSKTSDSK